MKYETTYEITGLYGASNEKVWKGMKYVEAT